MKKEIRVIRDHFPSNGMTEFPNDIHISKGDFSSGERFYSACVQSFYSYMAIIVIRVVFSREA